MNQATVKPNQIKVGVIVEIKFNDIPEHLFGVVTEIDYLSRKKFVESGLGGFTLSVLVQIKKTLLSKQLDDSLTDSSYKMDTINFDQIVSVSTNNVDFSCLM
jgi:hypothetical protein